jgi:virginiamycin B lyase
MAGEPMAVGKEPCYPSLSAFGSLWTPLCGAKALVRTEVPGKPAANAEAKPGSPSPPPDTPRPPVMISLGIQSAGPVVTGASSIWMISDAAGTLVRIDPDTNAVIAEVVIPAGSQAMAFGEGAVWVASAAKNSVTRINGDTNVVIETITVGPGPVSVTTGAGSVWTLNGGDGTISRIDPKTNKVTKTIKASVTGKTGSIVVGEGSVWASAPGFPLTRIDPATNAVVQQFSGPGGGVLALGHKSLWLTATPIAVWRIDPRRVEATRK